MEHYVAPRNWWVGRLVILYTGLPEARGNLPHKARVRPLPRPEDGHRLFYLSAIPHALTTGYTIQHRIRDRDVRSVGVVGLVCNPQLSGQTVEALDHVLDPAAQHHAFLL